MIASWTTTLNDTVLNLQETFDHFEGSWFESSKHRIVDKYRGQGKLSYCFMPPQLFRGFKPGAFSLEVYKMVKKYQWKNLNTSIRFEPAFLIVNVYFSTSEPLDSVRKLSNTPVLIKTYVTVILTRPTFIHSSATLSQWAAIFPKKQRRLFAHGFCLHSSSMSRTSGKYLNCRTQNL